MWEPLENKIPGMFILIAFSVNARHCDAIGMSCRLEAHSPFMHVLGFHIGITIGRFGLRKAVAWQRSPV